MLSSESANVFIKKFRDCFLWFGLVICVNAVLGLFHTFAMCLYFLNFSWPLVVAWPFYCSFLYFLGLLCEINFYFFFYLKAQCVDVDVQDAFVISIMIFVCQVHIRSEWWLHQCLWQFLLSSVVVLHFLFISVICKRELELPRTPFYFFFFFWN